MNTPHRIGRALLGLACLLALGACTSLPPDPAGAAETAQPGLDNQATYLALVRQMQGNGMWFASLAHIDALEQRWGSTPATRLLRAQAFRHTGQDAPSAALYEQLTGTTERAAALRGLGLLAGTRGDYAEAATLFQQAREARPTDGLLLNDLGYAYLMAGRFDAARLPLMQAQQLLPDHPRVRSNLALYLLTQGDTAAARRWMDEARLSDAARSAIEQQARVLAPASAPSEKTLRMSLRLENPPAPSTP
ncbi:tetratricopeptide repeat protein [Hydrogenophaga sp.]|uniref:tetratricopeptide repeat protein n=1 Tax=Hydrogenophaga sp. TaxID=1904254 RepID=UPI00263583DC|nr:tetratricopeptide repeat protein [Hydrogenophaga sp.]MCW5652850.1 tetratricopeptide repeat protein [Hydrogenophaga sp.]